MFQGKLRRRAAAALVGAVALLGVAGCGGGSDSGGSSAKAVGDAIGDAVKANGAVVTTTAPATAASSGGASAAGGSSTAPQRLWVSLGKTGWHDGFKVTLVDLEAEPGTEGTKVTLNIQYENLLDSSESPEHGELLWQGKVIYARWDSPRLPGGGKAGGTLEATVATGKTPIDKAGFDKLVSNLVLQFGDADDNQTIMPLDPLQAVTSMEPRAVPLTGKLQQGALVVEIVSASLRPSYQSGDKGKAELSMRIKVSCAANCSNYGISMSRDLLSLTTPKGTSASPDSRSRYCCDAVYPGSVSDKPGNIVTFLVPMPGTGAYTMTLKSESLSSEGAAPGTFAFTV